MYWVFCGGTYLYPLVLSCRYYTHCCFKSHTGTGGIKPLVKSLFYATLYFNYTSEAHILHYSSPPLSDSFNYVIDHNFSYLFSKFLQIW